jgi:hypothetical protein
VLAGDNSGSTLDLNVNSAFANLAVSDIILQAAYDITLAGGTLWDLSGTIGANLGGVTGGQLTLEAGRNIIFGNGSQIRDANNWSVTLQAGYDFVNQIVQSGVGNIYLNGSSGSIQLSQAAINLTAGNSIFVGSGCQLIDDGGVIGLYAQTVNQNGLIQANSMGSQHGTIELVASDSIALGANSQITANGDNSSSGSDGGQIMLQTAQTFSDVSGSQIETHGGANGGDGGRILIYAASSSVNSQLDVSALAAGSANGSIYYYPPVNGNLTLTADSLAPFSGFSSILFQASGSINIASFETLNLSVGTGSRTSGQLTLETGGDIVLKNGSQITDANDWAVTLEAGYDFANSSVTYGNNSITLNGNSSIQTALGNISLIAGQDITVNSGFVRTTGGGNISAWALAGNVNTGTDAKGYMFSSDSSTYCQVDPNLGGISTAAGGGVTITAGGDVASYLPYGNAGRTVGGDAGSGAFGPQAGDVTIVAGGNVTGHYVVANGTGAIYAGVEMDASGNPVKDASGHYVLNLSSTGSAGMADDKLALSLIAGGWTVDAAQDIYLQEVRNPNGIFNTMGFTSPTYHYFDYAPDAYVNLSAGNSLQLGDSSSSLPRNSGGVHVPFIYAPILNIVAGAGGVVLTGDSDPYDKLILFPSPQGSLTITTGGSLIGALPANSDGSPTIFDLIVSDSAQTQYYDNGLDIFGLTDHAATPVHINSPTPIVLNITGDMNSVLLGAPEAAQITVGGDMINSRFQGMNLSSDPNESVQVQVREIDGSLGVATVHPGVTSINVTGDILNRSDFTIFTLPDGAPVPDISKLAQAIDPLAVGLANKLFYEEVTDPVAGTVTRQLILQGALTPAMLSLLQNLTYQVYVNGQPQFKDDGQGGLTPDTTTINLLDPATTPGEAGATAQALIAAYYNPNTGPTYNPNAGPIPTSQDSGYLLGGGGQFNITARNIDLGTTLGIVSQGVSFDTVPVFDANGQQLYDANGLPVFAYPLAKYFTQGADINVTVSGNLDMFSTSISSVNGGNISVNAGGYVNAGSDVFTVNSESARGIFTAAQGDVSVIANGDINVNGSRIATFDGGNVTVESLAGNVNAGNGASSRVTVSACYVDPLTRQVYNTAPQLPFSGILALTFPERDSDYPAPVARLGNILVEAPQGDVIANFAGIMQVPLNQAKYPDAITMVLAGYELLDGAGNPVTAGDLAEGTPILISGNRDINASGSGILASNAKLEASGSIIGLIFALNNIDISAQQNINVTALGVGNVSVSSSGGTISGTIIGVGGVNASGSSIDASLVSANVTGNTSGQSGLGQGNAANATAQAASSDDSAKMAVTSNQTEDNDEKKKKGGGTALMQKTGRVTVLLPPKNLSQNQTSNNHL